MDLCRPYLISIRAPFEFAAKAPARSIEVFPPPHGTASAKTQKKKSRDQRPDPSSALLALWALGFGRTSTLFFAARVVNPE